MEELKKYCVPYGSLAKLRGYIIVLMMGIIFVAYKTIRNACLPVNYILLNIIMVFVAFVFGWVLYFVIKKIVFTKYLKLYESRMQTIQQKHLEEYVLSDFQNGSRELGDNLIVGEYCLIGRNMGMIAFYDDIQRVYQEAKTDKQHKAKEGESSSLKVVCGDKIYTLCVVTINDLFERDVTNICKSVNKRNVNFDY